MKLELLETKLGRWKLISHSSRKHPALEHMARYLQGSNKSPSNPKIGIFNVCGGEFSLFKTVYSYISHRTERMNRKKYYLWLKGLVQMKPAKPWSQVFRPGSNKEIDLMFEPEVVQEQNATT